MLLFCQLLTDDMIFIIRRINSVFRSFPKPVGSFPSAGGHAIHPNNNKTKVPAIPLPRGYKRCAVNRKGKGGVVFADIALNQPQGPTQFET